MTRVDGKPRRVIMGETLVKGNEDGRKNTWANLCLPQLFHLANIQQHLL